MTETLSLRGYARHRGVSPGTVSKCIANGRLEKAVTRDARGRLRIDVAVADKEWEANRDPAKIRDKQPPRDPALPLYAASCALVDLAVKIEECLEGARNETASRNPTAASVKVWRALYKTWGEMAPALETMQRECRRAAS